MARTVANLDVTTDNFQNWINKTNELLYAFSTEIITGNSSISNTGTTIEPRKAQLIGRFGANTLVATNELRGGNVGDSGYALLTITSNTLFGGNSSANASFVNAQANVFVNNAVLQVNSQTITVTGNTSIKGNTSVTAITVTGNATVSNTIITGTDLFVTAVNTSVNSRSIFTGNTYIKANSTVTNITVQGDNTTANTILAGNLTQITSNLEVTGTTKLSGTANALSTFGITGAANALSTFGVTGLTTLIGAANALSTFGISGAANALSTFGVTGAANTLNTLGIGGAANALSTFGVTGAANALSTFGVNGATTLASTLSVAGAANALSTFGVTGAANALSTFGVTGAANALSTLGVTGATTLANTLSVVGTTTINTDYVIQVTANSNLGATVGSPLLVYSFPKTTYSSAKITSQVKTSGGNTQISEIVLAHDTTTPYITVYATVASPIGANNGIYSVAINNANVELSFTQTSSSSGTKVVAHLIK